MRRRTLDIIFSTGAALMAILVLCLGLILQNQADYAESYVKDQLTAQKITFTPVAGLSPDEQQAACLVENAGKALTTGKQAECYTNEYIGRHVAEVNEGKTYSETSGEARALQAQADEATPGSSEAEALGAQAAEAQGKADTLFRGETLRGLLLTSYGFSIFGERAAQAALVAFALAAVLAIAAAAGFVHAFATKREVLVHDPFEAQVKEPELV